MDKDFYKTLDEFVNYGQKEKVEAERTIKVKYAPGMEAEAHIDYEVDKKLEPEDKRKAEDGISTLVAGARMMAKASNVDEGEFVVAVVGFAVKKIFKMGLGNMLEGLFND